MNTFSRFYEKIEINYENGISIISTIMRFLTNILQRIMMLQNNAKPMGRWKIVYCDKKINDKIDMANEDHCGPCGQYIIEKIKFNKVKDSIDSSIQEKVTK